MATMCDILTLRASNLGVAFTANDREILKLLREATIDVDKFDYWQLSKLGIVDFIARLCPCVDTGKMRNDLYTVGIKVSLDNQNAVEHNSKTRSMRRQYFLDCILANENLPLEI